MAGLWCPAHAAPDGWVPFHPRGVLCIQLSRRTGFESLKERRKTIDRGFGSARTHQTFCLLTSSAYYVLIYNMELIVSFVLFCP